MQRYARIRSVGMGIAWGLFCMIAAGVPSFAQEVSEFKKNRETFFSEFFDKNLYDEGVNQLDLGRWGRKLFGKAIPSANVNVFDEIPDSDFYTNRQGRQRLSASALEAGYQENSGPDLSKPLQIIAAEQRGIYPRFWAKDARGDEYLLEFDPQGNLGLVTGAEVVASRFYHALGYFVPQCTILKIKPDQFLVVPEATTWEDSGFKKILTQKRLEEYLTVLPQTAEGLYRASAQKLPPGEKRGPFSFESRRKDDSEDSVNHRDRREIRTLGIFASWLNHFNLCETGTQDMLVREKGQVLLRHYLIDFSGTLGVTSKGSKEPMLGYEHAIDYGETFKASLTLGFCEKPWQKKWRQAGGGKKNVPTLGYFCNELFDPARYKTQFPFESFRRVTRADGFWAAKLLESFSDEDVKALVKAGKYGDTEETALVKILTERRDLIARYWFSRSSPLDQFKFSNGKLSFKDLAVERGFEPKDRIVYRVEVVRLGKEKRKIFRFEMREPFVMIEPSWISNESSIKLILKTVCSSSEKESSSVEVILNSQGVQGIHHED